MPGRAGGSPPPPGVRAEYLGGAFGSRISAKDGEQEHAASPLGHAEVLRVEDAVGPPIPEVNQGFDDRPHVSAAVTAEEPLNVFHENGSGSNRLKDPVELPPQAGTLSGESGAATGDADVLAGEPPGDEINVTPCRPCVTAFAVRARDTSRSCQRSASSIDVRVCDITNVRPAGHPGPVPGEDGPGGVVNLTLSGALPPGVVEPMIQTSRTAEQGQVTRGRHAAIPNARG